MTGVDRLLAIARAAIGLTEDDAAFQALCGPGETPERTRELARLSTCALFLRGCLVKAQARPHDVGASGLCARCGADLGERPRCVPPRLWAPYVTGQAMADLVATLRTDGPPRFVEGSGFAPGKIVIVGHWSRGEHAYLVESIERDGWPDGSIELTAIEAGQVDERGRQCVRRKRHEIDAIGVDRVLGTWVSEDFYRVNLHPRPRPVAWVLDPRALLGDA